MSPTDGSRESGPEGGPAEVDKPSASPASRFAELLGTMAPPEPVERLEVLETLSYGTLYEGRIFHASRSERVSLLLLDPALAEAASSSPAIVRTLLAASRIRGPHLQTARALCRHGESLYEIYDAHTGTSLAAGFDFLARAGLRLSPEAVLRIVSSALHALDELERAAAAGGEGLGIRCHGLLDPENFFVTEDQKVLVRGVGLWQSGIARTGLLGARQRRYVSAGQAADGSASPRHDLLSLGAIVFEAMTGSPAFDSSPTDEDVAELTARIEEMRTESDVTRRELLGLSVAFLNPVAVTAASRARLRILVDTTFLREAARERVAGILSLEDLAARVRSARPAIVKAVALSLESVEMPSSTARPGSLPQPSPLASPPGAAAPLAPENPGSPAAPAPSAATTVPALPARAAAPSGPDGDAAPRSLFRRLAAFRARPMTLLAALLVLAAASVFVGDRACQTRPRAEELEALPQIAAEEPAPAPEAVPSAAPSSESASPAASPAPLAAEGARAGSGIPARPGKEADRRKARPAKRPAGPPLPAILESQAPSAAAEPPLPPVAAGSLVELGAPGLVPPVLIDRPEEPRFSPQDPRPASPGSVLLDILVDEHGSVRDHRIISATRFPAGIAAGIAHYIGALHFQPPQLRGVPVRVWIRHEMRFQAP